MMKMLQGEKLPKLSAVPPEFPPSTGGHSNTVHAGETAGTTALHPRGSGPTFPRSRPDAFTSRVLSVRRKPGYSCPSLPLGQVYASAWDLSRPGGGGWARNPCGERARMGRHEAGKGLGPFLPHAVILLKRTLTP